MASVAPASSRVFCQISQRLDSSETFSLPGFSPHLLVSMTAFQEPLRERGESLPGKPGLEGPRAQRSLPPPPVTFGA